MRTVLIINPNSAGGETRHRWAKIESKVRFALGEFQPLFTERRGHAVDLTRRALREGADRIIALGGDGTINEVVNGFFDGDRPVKSDAAFGLLPAGTGGDFARTIGAPRSIDYAARALAEATPRPIDVGRLAFESAEGKSVSRYFVNIASFGISGLVDRYVNNSSKSLGGRISFYLASMRATFHYENVRCRIRLDNHPAVESTIFGVAVANGRFFGGGMMVAPDARMDDGCFDVVQIGDVTVAAVLLNMPKIYSGRHLTLPWITVQRAVKVRAEPIDGEEILIDVDGEQPGRLPATFEVVPRAIHVLG